MSPPRGETRPKAADGEVLPHDVRPADRRASQSWLRKPSPPALSRCRGRGSPQAAGEIATPKGGYSSVRPRNHDSTRVYHCMAPAMKSCIPVGKRPVKKVTT